MMEVVLMGPHGLAIQEVHGEHYEKDIAELVSQTEVPIIVFPQNETTASRLSPSPDF